MSHAAVWAYDVSALRSLPVDASQNGHAMMRSQVPNKHPTPVMLGANFRVESVLQALQLMYGERYDIGMRFARTDAEAHRIAEALLKISREEQSFY